MPSSCSCGEHARRLGPRSIRQPDPAQRARVRCESHGCSRRALGLTELGVKLRAAETGFVDVTMAAQVILDRVDLAQGSEARNRGVIVGDRHVQAHAAGMPGDRLAEHMPAAIAQSGGDPQHLIFIFLSGRADHLDDVRLTEGQSSGLVEGQGAQAADFLEIFTAANQHPPRAAAARPQTMATGVAITRAQGQAITSTTSPRPNQSRHTSPSPVLAVPVAQAKSGGPSITSRDNAMTIGV